MQRSLRVGLDGRIFALAQMRGLTRYAVNLARALAKRDDIELVIFCKEGPAAHHVAEIPAEFHVLPGGREWRWSILTLPRAIRAARVDVFHALADRGLPFVKVCPLVITIHGSYERAHWRAVFSGFKSRAWYWAHTAAAWFLADRVLTVSAATSDELLRLHVARRSQIRSIHLAPAAEFSVESPGDDGAVLDQLDVRRPYLLFVGGYDQHKNVETLVAAFSRLDLSDHQLVLVADHQWRFSQLHHAWQELPCFARLRCIEVMPEYLPALYRQAAVCVVPSRWDSFGLQLVEAMACGTPVIASDLPAFREVGGDALLRFDASSVPDLTAALRRVLEDAELRAQLIEQGTRRVSCMSWDRTAEQTVEVYREVVRTRRASTSTAGRRQRDDL